MPRQVPDRIRKNYDNAKVGGDPPPFVGGDGHPSVFRRGAAGQPRRRFAQLTSRGNTSTETITATSTTDTGRCKNTPQWPSPIESALRICASASGPRIMPTTTGAVGKLKRRITTPRMPIAYSSTRSKALCRMPYTPTEKKLSKHPEEFGTTGAIEGVAGPEAANNAAITATLIPLLTLGIPTSNTTAILLGAFQNYGIQPGPQLFDRNAGLVWALIASMYIGNVMLLILNLPLVGLWVKLLKIPKPPLYAGILIFATVGVYGMRQSAFDLVLLYAIGILGVVMRRFSFPTAPVVVGMILGPLAEAQMRNALSIGEGHWGVFLQRPVSVVLVVVIVSVLVLPRLVSWAKRRRG